MISVKFIGGAKKSFPQEQLQVNESDISVEELCDLLLKLTPEDSPNLDFKNILIAINGADSSALDGTKTILKDNPRFTVRKNNKIIKHLNVVVIDKNLNIPLNTKILKNLHERRLIIFTSKKNPKSNSK